ncbi:hypothetical protein M1B72_07285 [Geomonas paludis]|uniref:Uncharacterized protein n=1 Tax=Geomonas paludis TaxID=2740185 RepID=A0ABY4LI32_9BACT|nr:hypothetical protein [Geomonas paludis]UPU37499.1 hypothetical protein M1B72_07285 [Geomonas paludis]
MFSTAHHIASRQNELFSASVRDEFGASLVSEVFEPMIEDVSALQRLNDHYQNTVYEVDSITEQLRSIS